MMLTKNAPVVSGAIPSIEPVSDRLSLLNSLYTTGTRGMVGLARVGIPLLMARHFGKVIFGEIALAMSVLEVFRAFSEFGVDTVSVRTFAKLSENESQRVLSHVLGTKLLLASASYAIAMLVLFGLATDARQVAFGAVVTISVFTANLVGSSISFSQARFATKPVFCTTLIAFVACVAATIWLMQIGAPPIVVLAVIPGWEGLNLLLFAIFGRAQVRFSFSLTEARDLLKLSFPIGLMTALIFLYMRLDSIVLFRVAGSAALGLYAAAYRTIDPAFLVPQAFGMTLYAALSRTEGGVPGNHLGRTAWRTMWPAYALIAVFGAIGLTVGPAIWSKMFPGYGPVALVLRIVIFCLFVRTFNTTATAMLCARGEYSSLAKIAVSTLLLNVVAIVLLVPRWGVLGAACAALLTEIWNGVQQYARLAMEQQNSKEVHA